jgi:hypothetical protein
MSIPGRSSFGQLPEPPSFLGWVAQLIAVYAGSLIGYFLIHLVFLRGVADSPAELVFDYVLFAAEALTFAWVAAYLFPRSTGEGRWIWTLPVVLLSMTAFITLYRGDSREFRALWFSEYDIPVIFFTLPTWACCWYSAAMKLFRTGRPVL